MDPYALPTSTVCPQCATEVRLDGPVDEPSPLRGGDRLVWKDWELRRDELYFQIRYVVDYPPDANPRSDTLVEELSSRSYVWLTSIPISVSAVFLARIMPTIHINQMLVLVAILLVALLPLAFIGNSSLSEGERTSELVEAFWEAAVPRFHEKAFDAKAIRLVGDVCRWELSRESPLFRYGELLRQASLIENALRERPELKALPDIAKHLAPIAARIYREGTFETFDLTVRLADDLAWAAKGVYPLEYADELLRLFPRAMKDREIRLRLRILLCQRWFEAGWQPRSMHLLGQLFPNLGQAIASENEAGLWNLFTLWKRGKVQDWKTLGTVETVFDLANQSGGASAILEQEPDLLMVIQRPEPMNGNRGHSIIVCEEGLFLDKQRIANGSVDVSTMALRDTVRRLKAWMDYYFETFQHYVAHYQQQEKAAYHDLIWKQRLTRCPNCKAVFLGVPAEAGIAVGEVA